MITIDITSDMISEAKELADKLGVLNNSIRKGKGNIVGYLGELAFLKAFPKASRVDSYECDIVVGNYSVEVKTKDRTVPARIDYEASVANYNTKQNADMYVFISLLRKGNSYIKAYIMGFIPKKEYFDRATFLQKGDVDPTNNWTVNADCWNLPYSKLLEFK